MEEFVLIWYKEGAFDREGDGDPITKEDLRYLLTKSRFNTWYLCSIT